MFAYSGVAVSCGECSSSGTSDITEPGSPCSTSSDEGVGIRGTAPSPLPSLTCKLAPQTPPAHSGPRPQWPWTPPLAVTACSTYKRFKAEPEAGALPRAGAADPTARQPGKQPSVKHQLQSDESQGKITEYFKAQIKPQQPKVTEQPREQPIASSSSLFFLLPSYHFRSSSCTYPEATLKLESTYCTGCTTCSFLHSITLVCPVTL